MSFVSYAQNCEDVMLWRALKHIDRGFYVDVGANDPVDDSVTKAFYDHGWCGINIEPVTGWYEKLCSQRPRDITLQIAAGDHNGELDLFEVVDTGLSTTNESYAKKHAEQYGYHLRQLVVSVQTLSHILSKHELVDIHFLKIDVEGGEKSVLRGLDLTNIRPWIIVIEATKPMSPVLDFEEWESLITNQNYAFVYFDGINRFYVANEHAELSEAFRLPPNIWDRYERFVEHRIRSEVQTTIEENDVLKAELVAQEESKKTIEASLSRLEADVSRLLNSRSMKVTAPLRRGLDIARKIKRLPRSLPRKLVRAVVEEPRLRKFAKPVADRLPALRYRLSYLLYEEKKPDLTVSGQLDYADLPPRSARILRDIRRTLQTDH